MRIQYWCRTWVLACLALTWLLGAAPAFAQSGGGDFEVVRKAANAYLNSGRPLTISADALNANLSDGNQANDPFILSVRSPEHDALGHIPGAVTIPLKTLAKPESLARLPKDRPIVVYCYTGMAGQMATTILSLLGYHAVNLAYGMMGWTKDDKVLATTRFGPTTDQRDYPLETKVNNPTATYPLPSLSTGASGDREIIRIAADKWLNAPPVAAIVPADTIYANLTHGNAADNLFIVSVRAPEHYALGHIPGAVNVPLKVIAKPENLAKLPPDRPIAVYCYTGHAGQVATTVLGLMGYQASNIKNGIMGWTMDDKVLAVARFGPDVQRDYRLEVDAAPATSPTAGQVTASDAPAAPKTMPVTGGAASLGLVAVAGAASLSAGLLLRRRQ